MWKKPNFLLRTADGLKFNPPRNSTPSWITRLTSEENAIKRAGNINDPLICVYEQLAYKNLPVHESLHSWAAFSNGWNGTPKSFGRHRGNVVFIENENAILTNPLTQKSKITSSNYNNNKTAEKRIKGWILRHSKFPLLSRAALLLLISLEIEKQLLFLACGEKLPVPVHFAGLPYKTNTLCTVKWLILFQGYEQWKSNFLSQRSNSIDQLLFAPVSISRCCVVTEWYSLFYAFCTAGSKIKLLLQKSARATIYFSSIWLTHIPSKILFWSLN